MYKVFQKSHVTNYDIKSKKAELTHRAASKDNITFEIKVVLRSLVSTDSYIMNKSMT